MVLNHLVGNPGEGCLAGCCRVKLNWLQTTWWVTLEREVWHGAVTTLPPKLSLASMLAKAEVRASVLCFQCFIVFQYFPCHGLATTLLLRWLNGPGHLSLELKTLCFDNLATVWTFYWAGAVVLDSHTKINLFAPRYLFIIIGRGRWWSNLVRYIMYY